MIQFTLKCSKDHRFDSWFKSGDAFEKLRVARMVSCAVCGDTDVSKAMMAPRVSTTEAQAPAPAPAPTPAKPNLSEPASPAEQALTEMRKYVEKNSDYVGTDFASEARAMHTGDAPERSIWGEAKAEDAKKLVEDGVSVTPLPFTPTRKTN